MKKKLRGIDMFLTSGKYVCFEIGALNLTAIIELFDITLQYIIYVEWCKYWDTNMIQEIKF